MNNKLKLLPTFPPSQVGNNVDSIQTDLNPGQCWCYGELNVVCARSNVGKTSFMLNAALHVLEHGADSLCIFSLEMSAQQLVARLFSMCSGIETSKIKETGSIDQLEGTRTVIADLENIDLYIDDTPAISIEEIGSKIREMYDKNLTRVFFIDYLELITTTIQQFSSRQDELKYILEELVKLTRELNLIIIVLSQLGKSTDPELSITIHNIPDFYCGTSIIDSIFVLARPGMYHRSGDRNKMFVYDISDPEDLTCLIFDPATGKVIKS